MRTVLPNGLPRLLTAARWSRYFPSMRGMSGRRRSLTSGVGLCVGVAALAGCAQPAEPPSGTGPVTYRYTCCESADLDPVLHPGDVLVLHWIVEAVPPTRTYPETAVTLSASLSGSFTDAAQLKGSVGAVVPSHEVAAAPLQTTTRAGGAPVSTIAIPADATPGMYALTTSVESGGGRGVGQHIVRVEARTAS